MRRKAVAVCCAAAGVILLLAAAVKLLYARRPLRLTFDAAYYWTVNSYQGPNWKYEEFPSGHKYYLYLPEKYRGDKNNADAHLPLIVTFHGSGEKGSAITKMGRRFIAKEFQERISPQGAAVLVMLSRHDYFSDTHSMSLLIQNVALRYKCIDASSIVGYGFSQGANYVMELACEEPSLFKAVISGSGYYQISTVNLIRVLPVSFYSALSENDKGIFEQGVGTGRLCARFCRNSRYVQYKQRYHFWVELYDKTGRGEETMEDWLVDVLRKN